MFRYFALTIADATSRLGDTMAIPAVVLALHVALVMQLAVISAYVVMAIGCRVRVHRKEGSGTN